MAFLTLVAEGLRYSWSAYNPSPKKTYHGHITLTHKTTVNAWTVRIEATGLVFEGIGETRSQALHSCLLYTSPSPRDRQKSRMPSSA